MPRSRDITDALIDVAVIANDLISERPGQRTETEYRELLQAVERLQQVWEGSSKGVGK